MSTVSSPEGSSLGHLPSGPWEFDEAVTSVFEDMLRRSIPQYDVMREAVSDIGARFVQPQTHIVDLGCSKGDSLAPFIARFGDRNMYVGIEVSEPMLNAARQRFAHEIARGLVSIVDQDLRNAYPDKPASLTLSVLSLQFVPIDHRQRVLRNVYANTVSGGALVLVEKLLGATAELNEAMIRLYHARKRTAGYTEEEVERKRLALEGVLVPVTARWNEELLRTAGFEQVDCFWRWMNFAGWVAVK